MIVRLASDQDVPGLVALAGQVGPWFGPMASDPVVSRLVQTLAADEPAALAAIQAARAAARERGPGHWPGTRRRARTAGRSSSTWTPPS